MRKIIKLIKEANNTRLWALNEVLVEYEDGIQSTVFIHPTEYKAELLKQQIIEKHPNLQQDIETLINLYREHYQEEEARND